MTLVPNPIHPLQGPAPDSGSYQIPPTSHISLLLTHWPTHHQALNSWPQPSQESLHPHSIPNPFRQPSIRLAFTILHPRYRQGWWSRSWPWSLSRCRNSGAIYSWKRCWSQICPTLPAAQGSLLSRTSKCGWNVFCGWLPCCVQRYPRRPLSCGPTRPQLWRQPTTMRGQTGWRMTASFGAICWHRETRTGRSPTAAYTAEHLQAMPGPYLAAYTTSQRTT